MKDALELVRESALHDARQIIKECPPEQLPMIAYKQSVILSLVLQAAYISDASAIKRIRMFFAVMLKDTIRNVQIFNKQHGVK